MATITITLPDDAAACAEKHARELGYEDAADWAFEMLRNYAALREDALYTRMHAGEQNPVFGRSRREQADWDAREAARIAEEARVEAEVKAKAKAKADAESSGATEQTVV